MSSRLIDHFRGNGYLVLFVALGVVASYYAAIRQPAGSDVGGAAQIPKAAFQFVYHPDRLPDGSWGAQGGTGAKGFSGRHPRGTASFWFSSSKAGASFECRLDGPSATRGSYSACSSPQDYGGLADGSYTFSVRRTDAANNADASPDTETFTVDTVPPQTTIESGPTSPPTMITSAEASFVVSSSQPAGDAFQCILYGPVPDKVAQKVARDLELRGLISADVDAAELPVKVDTSCRSSKSYNGLADGSYTFSVSAKDAASNGDQTPAARAFTVDTS